MARKTRVNWTIHPDVLKLLEATQKSFATVSRETRSLSWLVEHAVKKTYKDPIEALREEAKHHQRELYRCQERIKELEETKVD